MRPVDVLRSVRDRLQESDELPDSVSYIVQEYDGDGVEGDVPLPVVEITPVTAVDLSLFNTDLAGYVTDADGNRVGREYRSEYEFTVQIDVLTVDQRSNEQELIEPLSSSLRQALYAYDSAGPSRQLADDVWRFSLEDGERADEQTTSPTLRRWRQDVVVWTYETFTTTEDYIVDVSYPADGEMTSTNGRIEG